MYSSQKIEVMKSWSGFRGDNLR